MVFAPDVNQKQEAVSEQEPASPAVQVYRRAKENRKGPLGLVPPMISRLNAFNLTSRSHRNLKRGEVDDEQSVNAHSDKTGRSRGPG